MSGIAWYRRSGWVGEVVERSLSTCECRAEWRGVVIARDVRDSWCFEVRD